MRPRAVLNVVYKGHSEGKTFYKSFQAKVLTALQRRGLLTEEQLEKGLKSLREKSR